MTATTTPPPSPPATHHHHTGHATLWRVIQSEWTKLRSVRSTFWTVLAMFVVTVGFSLLLCWGVAATWDEATASNRASFDATSMSLAGMTFGQLAIVVLGVMVISTEYSTGGIRATLTAVPRREKVLAAKGIVLIAFSLVVGLVTSFASFFVGQALLSIADIQTSLGEPEVLRGVVGGGLYLAASALFGFSLGALLRNTAGGITLAVAGLFVLPLLALALPGSWGDAIERFFTSNAGQQIMVVHQTSDNVLGPWAGFAVFCAWGVVILLVAAVLMNRRDA